MIDRIRAKGETFKKFRVFSFVFRMFRSYLYEYPVVVVQIELLPRRALRCRAEVLWLHNVKIVHLPLQWSGFNDSQDGTILLAIEDRLFRKADDDCWMMLGRELRK